MMGRTETKVFGSVSSSLKILRFGSGSVRLKKKQSSSHYLFKVVIEAILLFQRVFSRKKKRNSY